MELGSLGFGNRGIIDKYNLIEAALLFVVLVVWQPPAPLGDVAQAVNGADLNLIVSRPTFLDIASVVQSVDLIRQLGRTGAVVLNQTPAPRGESRRPRFAVPRRPWPSRDSRSWPA